MRLETVMWKWMIGWRPCLKHISNVKVLCKLEWNEKIEEELPGLRTEMEQMKSENKMMHKIIVNQQRFLENVDAEECQQNVVITGLMEDPDEMGQDDTGKVATGYWYTGYDYVNCVVTGDDTVIDHFNQFFNPTHICPKHLYFVHGILLDFVISLQLVLCYSFRTNLTLGIWSENQSLNICHWLWNILQYWQKD